MARIKILSAQIAADAFVDGKNFGTKFGNNKQKPFNLIYDTQMEMLIVQHEGRTALVPVFCVNHMVPEDVAALKIEQWPPRVPPPSHLGPIGPAQVSDPTKPEVGVTGLNLKGAA